MFRNANDLVRFIVELGSNFNYSINYSIIRKKKGKALQPYLTNLYSR